MNEKAQCVECTSTFELIPPADKDYSIPKETPAPNGEHVLRIYECEEGHRNTIYWHKIGETVIIKKGYSTKFND